MISLRNLEIRIKVVIIWGLPGWLRWWKSACSARDLGSIPGSGRSSGEGNGLPTPVFLPGKFHGQRNLVGCSQRGHKELDTTEWLTSLFIVSITDAIFKPLVFCLHSQLFLKTIMWSKYSYYLLQNTKLPQVTHIVTWFFHLASSSFTIQPIATVPPIIRDYSGSRRSTTLKTAWVEGI